MKQQSFVLASVGTAVLASLCCIGPLIAVFLGAGMFAAAATFEAARPYFLVLTAGLLAGGFFLTYRRSERACREGSCQSRTPSGFRKTLQAFIG